MNKTKNPNTSLLYSGLHKFPAFCSLMILNGNLTLGVYLADTVAFQQQEKERWASQERLGSVVNESVKKHVSEETLISSGSFPSSCGTAAEDTNAQFHFFLCFDLIQLN